MENGVKWRWKKMVKKKKVVIGVTGVILISAISGGIFLLHGKSTLAMKTESVVQTAKAEKGSISNTVTGTGNLEADTAQDIEIPSSIQIDQVLVESGDHVSAGDVLATVDNTSVLSALQEMQETIGDLDEEINEKKDDLMEGTIETQVSGRVKKIYVSSGDSVSDSMVTNGALMLLSVDGKMSLTLTGVSGVAAGDSVNVNLSDGSVEEGTVESLSGGNCVITLTDDGVPYGDTATVTTTDGTELGFGTLGNHQQLSIMGTAGTVSGVSVSENENVDSGETLLSLTDVPSSTEYQELLAQREAAAATMNKLLKLSQTGNITSEMDGTIQNVNISSNFVSSSSSSSSGTSDSAGSSAVKTSTGSGIAGSGAVTNYAASLMQYNGGTATLTAETDNGLSDESSVSISSREDQEETEDEEDSSLNIQIGSSSEKEGVNLVIATPETDGQSQTKIITDESSGFTGTISWNPSDGTFHESSVYQANITLSANEGYRFEAGSTKIEIGTVSGITVGDSGKTLSFMVTFPKTAAKQTDTENKDEGSSGSGNSSGSNNTNASTNTSANTSASGSGSAGNSSVKASSNSGSSTSGSTSSGSSGSGSNSTSSSSSGSDSSSTSTEDHTDVTAFTISSDENMILSVNVDELDINSIALDQEAEVTFDAIEEGSFTGTIISIGNTASASGGVAKYAVSVSIPKDERMKVGMNASAVITIENREDIITIPMNALQERGGSSFVYTSQEEDGSLSGEVEVTTGLSDGSTVEITEGLSEGDAVYYQKTGSSDSSSKDIQMPDFGNMNGEMPSGEKPNFGGGNGGSRPSGGGTGGQ